jgi:hypothetical protein
MLPTPDLAVVERCFETALSIARQREVRSLELRAATSLARLWRQQGMQQRASAALLSVYAWFTDGLELADLVQARALLDELAAAM